MFSFVLIIGLSSFDHQLLSSYTSIIFVRTLIVKEPETVFIESKMFMIESPYALSTTRRRIARQRGRVLGTVARACVNAA